ncbi:hypothetical protein [Aliiruegeria sabulilitoris]|nr:hypothetical protein [Aliiruegeria sabulilitoris]
MSNRSWFILALVIAALIGLNFLFGWQMHIFLGRKFDALIEWMAFWR